MNLTSRSPRRSRSETLHRNIWGLALTLCALRGSAELARAYWSLTTP
ncbi:MAG: hypothetical protein VCB99_09320 [Myxococcota bacterium]